MTYKVINIDKETMGGTPVFKGTRVPIKSLFDWLKSGKPLDEFLENFPSVKREDAVKLLKLAGKALTNKKLLDEYFAG